MKSPRIDIVLASYNGAKFLSQQIDSILEQTYPDIHLWIRDDGSKDDSLKIIKEKQELHPSKITLLSSETNLGIISNFSALLHATTADYIMLSDQDDLWLPDKVVKTVVLMQKMEQKYGQLAPILIHTDLNVVDYNLKQISSSFWRYTKINPNKGRTLNRILMQNVVTGCTMMMNRSLLELVMPIPVDCVMHDWWIGLVAAALGHIAILDEPTMLYRQHGSNQLGAQKQSFFKQTTAYLKNPTPFLTKVRKTLEKQKQQAFHLKARHIKQLSSEQLDLIEAFCLLDYGSYMSRWALIVKHGFYKHGWLRNLLTFCLYTKP